MRDCRKGLPRMTVAAVILVTGFVALPARAQDSSHSETDNSAAPTVESSTPPEPPETDILSADTLSIIVDGRLVLANGARSWVHRGLGKTRFDGTSSGDAELQALPIEGDLIWQPRFTRTLNGNVSVSWQRDHEDAPDVMEAYLAFNPARKGTTSFALKGGLYWPEISLEHATGGAWSTVYTLTPSAINSWVGEEVKVVGAEATLFHTIGSQDLSFTAGVFGFNDTSGTLLSFRGWALHDVKSTLFGHFPLPPLNSFITLLQQHETRSVAEIDNRPGFYGRAEWRPSGNFVLNAFYYDNRGNPQAFWPSGQWGWRTRFLNLGLVANLGASTRLLAQAMQGTTKMGFKTGGQVWVSTRFRSAYALLSRQVGAGALSGRIEWFDTKERGSQMSHADESEDGWAATAALRWPLWNHFTGFLEALHVESDRGRRLGLGIPAEESQNVLQAALRLRW